MSCCGNQWSEIKKFGADECFSCLGNSKGMYLQAGHNYATCSPLVQGKGKGDPLMPMTSPDECIVAWVGPYCGIDATEWTEDCKQHVYTNATVYIDRANWPCDEEGKSLFTLEDLELIDQGHTCCIGFDRIQKCEPAREWLVEADATHTGK